MMSGDWLAGWFDNPIFVKHLRSRLRPQPLASAVTITLVLCLCIVYAGFQLNAFQSGGAFGALFALQAIVLGIIGTAQVSTSVSTAKTSGILDFHRVSPLSPAELVFGFFFGPPVREYLLFACTLPFAAFCLAVDALNFRELLQLMILLISTSWVLHGLSLVSALATKRQSAGARGVLGFIIFSLMLSNGLFTGFGNVLNTLDHDPRLDFFGVSLPWLVVVLLYQIPVLLFTYLAARRKMESERLHPFSKPQGGAAMATLGVLALGGVWTMNGTDWMALGLIYVLAAVGLIVTVMVTPTQAEYSKGVWRALRPGQPRVSYWDDLAINRVFLITICAVVLAAATIGWNRLAERRMFAGTLDRDSFPLAIANGVLVVAYFGLAHQYFQLRFGRRGANYLALFLFLTWGVPLLVGSILLFASFADPGPAQIVYALSPVAGIGLSTEIGDRTGVNHMAVQAAAITPSLLFTFVFNGLVSSARRRVGRVVAAGYEKARITGAENGLSEP